MDLHYFEDISIGDEYITIGRAIAVLISYLFLHYLYNILTIKDFFSNGLK